MRRLETNYSTLAWSADGATVTKTRRGSGDARRRFLNELRVNRLLTAIPPPVPTPRLLDSRANGRSLTFEAVPGEPRGPKYPLALDGAAIDAMCATANALRGYRLRRRWMRRLDLGHRFDFAARRGLLEPGQADALMRLAGSHTRLRFAHGDITARNVMGDTLIDWEWAGLYPAGYDLAFLWYSLVDVDGGRERVEQNLDDAELPFLLSALAIQLWHLAWYLPAEFRPKHVATCDALLTRLGVPLTLG